MQLAGSAGTPWLESEYSHQSGPSLPNRYQNVISLPLRSTIDVGKPLLSKKNVTPSGRVAAKARYGSPSDQRRRWSCTPAGGIQ